jgi:type IX secretion system PorP/SprF family membrane protein
MRKYLPLFVLAFLASAALRAQDQHFSQFFASPLTLNPALAGTFQGNYRLALIYRDQDIFRTFSGAIDFRFPLSPVGKRYRDAFGVGVVFYNDKVPEVGYSNNQINVAGSFHKSLSRSNDQFLSAGFQVGISQRNFSYESLFFEDQFAGAAGYANPTGEILPENNFAVADFAAGINYAYSPERRTGFYAGASMYHITEPSISLYFDPEEPERNEQNNLLRKYTAYASLSIPAGETVRIQPRALFYMQGPHAAINAGSNLRLLVGDISGTALHLGGWVRPVRNADDSFSLDAVVGMVGLEFNNFLLGLSYDAKISPVATGRQQRGAFEISIAYLGEYDSETILCPKF